MLFTFITNHPGEAQVALAAGVQRIFVDLERALKLERQANRGTFISDHTLEDLARMRRHFPAAEILVRINSIHAGSAAEVAQVLGSRPDLVMLPYFVSLDEVRAFLDLLPAEVRPVLLLETAAALRLLPQLLAGYPVREYHIGLNDLSLDLGHPNFIPTLGHPLFVEAATQLRGAGLPWGLGGVGDPWDAGVPIPTREFFAFQVAQGVDRALFSRNFRALFKRPDAPEAVARAHAELERIAEDTRRLDPAQRAELCARFLEAQRGNRGIPFYR